ncbi:MAG: YHS domain-containing protein [Planctomycetaceae bacterium]|nr:YHS domain-containing protein [Planctomycetaceae bacterium]
MVAMAAALLASMAHADRPVAQEGLEKFNGLIGEWRGVGQPQRGSNRGAWQQNSEWVWNFDDGGVAIDYRVTDGQLVRSGRLTFDPESGLYQFVVQDPQGVERTYLGRLADDKLTVEAEPDAEGVIHRVTVTLLNDKRTLVLHEKRDAVQPRFSRVAEIGYTRAGVRLANPGSGQPECIVTGGAGTIQVSYEGKTYYVCCSGCKQAFDDDPAGIIQEAAERKKREAAEKK